jgi:hypothetical protein
LPWEAKLGRRLDEVISLMEKMVERIEAEQCFDISQTALRVGLATGKACCLTPGAEVWLRSEGRLLKGEEALRAQGFWQAGRQRLAEFTDKQLRGLAGNAFSAGCVASALLVLLVVMRGCDSCLRGGDSCKGQALSINGDSWRACCVLWV